MVITDYIKFFFLVLFNGVQIIDLTRVSQELAYLANDVDLVILEGMVSSSFIILSVLVSFKLN